MLVTTDYTGRTRDVHILHGASPSSPDAQRVSPEFGKISSFCTGVQKLVQRYTIAFLTNLGSQPTFPSFGTNFIKNISSTNQRVNLQDVYHLYVFANSKVLSEFRAYQRQGKDLPLDEQLNYTTLRNVTSVGGAVFLDIKLITLAGDQFVFVLPLPKQ